MPTRVAYLPSALLLPQILEHARNVCKGETL